MGRNHAIDRREHESKDLDARGVSSGEDAGVDCKNHNMPADEPDKLGAFEVQGSTKFVAKTNRSGQVLPGLDVLRGLAALGVVLLHACVPYMDPPVPGLTWSVMDEAHWFASQCFWLIELFIMPIFLILAGYFAWGSLRRSGIRRLIHTRARRLLIPLGFGMAIVLPADLYIWLTGWVADGKIPLRKLKSLKFAGGVDQDLWGLSHLWFLEYLFLYMVVLGLAYAAYQRLPSLSRLTRSPIFCLGSLFTTASLVLWFHPEVVWGFQHRFYPVPSKWIYSGTFFAAGVWFAVADREMQWLAKNAMRNAGYSLALIIPAMLLGQWHLRGGDQAIANMMLAMTTTAAASITTISLMGFAARLRQAIAVPWQYLAAASFWIYLVHHPLLGLLQIDLKWLLPEASPVLKVLLGWACSVSLSLLTYEVWIRKTWLGGLLGFGYSIAAVEQTTKLSSELHLHGDSIVKLADRRVGDHGEPESVQDTGAADDVEKRRAA
ncbi:MAG: acyltransferase family protein [Rubripirellula sp.]